MPVLTLASMDYVRGALLNAMHSGLTLDDVCRMAVRAETPEAFDSAVNALAETVPDAQRIHPMIEVA